VSWVGGAEWFGGRVGPMAKPGWVDDSFDMPLLRVVEGDRLAEVTS
jgi:hypothetical protein